MQHAAEQRGMISALQLLKFTRVAHARSNHVPFFA